MSKITPDDQIKYLLKTREDLQRQFEPLGSTLATLKSSNSLKHFAEEADSHARWLKAALGPMEDLRRSSELMGHVKSALSSFQADSALAQYQDQFRLPQIGEAARLLREFEMSGATKMLDRYREDLSAIGKAMEAMRSPWLNIENQLESITDFATLQSMGILLNTMQPFNESLADKLRINLGDWRTEISWPEEIFNDIVARTAFYSERGLYPTLTAFPVDAFEQCVRLAGLKREPPPLLHAYSSASDGEDDEDEERFERTNAAHRQLLHFETQLRRFLDEKMKAAFGNNWIKHQVPGPILTSWRDKRQKALDNNEPGHPLIAYADFTDYVPIITRKDNWEAVFEPVFKRMSLVQESFQRLYPIRICTMHARLITQDDELYLHVEVKRILAAIGVII